MSDLRIHAALAPRVAVLSSPDVDRIIQLNGIPDLPTLLRPFESSVERLSVRTSQLETRICDRFPLRFDPYSLFNPDAAHAISAWSLQSQPRPSAVGRSNEELLDRINQLIATNIKRWDGLAPRPPSSPSTNEPLNEVEGGQEGGALAETLRKIQQTPLEESTPWFAAVQQLVFGQRSIAKHESFGHPVAVLLAVSSASPDPMNDFARLYETSSQQQPFPAHPYINPDTLKYYVLIHDVRTSGTDLSGSKEILEQIKKTYGLHCCLLAINSKDEGAGVERGLAGLWKDYLPISPVSPTSPNPDSDAALEGVAKYLDEEDIKRIKNFIRELTAQSIVPFMERYVQHMGEYLANSRKGLTNRLFGASRKFFSSSSATDKTAGLATSGGYDAQLEFYPYSSIEAQTRRLADFAFTIRDYKLAAAMYDLGRRDFSNDKAHKHIAGATEMFGLSHLMQMFASRAGVVDVDSYLAQACQEYSLRSSTTTAVGVEESYGLRATLLYYEAYRMLNYLKPAPAGLLRMAMRSEEVLAPLLLEQAALTYLQQRPAALRKYALHLVGAAHRYQACGQKLLSLRCYAQAALVYRGKGWGLVENHIERELGMQAYNEGNSDAAVEHLIRLIRPNGGAKEEQEAILGDVVNAYKYSTAGGEMELKWEIFDTNTARLNFGDEGGDEGVWEGLEQQLIDTGLGERVGANRERRRKRPVGKNPGQGGEVAVGQTFWLDIIVRNPLAVDLAVDNIKPILQLNGAPLSAEQYETDPHPPLTLSPLEQRPIRLSLRIHTETKQLRLANLNFRLAETILLTQKLDKKGKRLNSTKDQRTTTSYAPDTSLAVTVHAARPTLTARIADAPEELFLGEERRVKVVIKNEGGVAVDDVRALCSASCMASFAAAAAEGRGEDGGRVMMPNGLNAAGPEFVLDSDGTTQLAPGEEKELEFVVRATTPGDLTLSWLLAFSPVGKEETYLSRLSFSTRVTPAIEVRVETVPRRSKAPEYDVIVEVTNRLKKQQVRLNGLSLLSPRFGFAGATDQGDKGEVVIAGNQTWRGRFVITPLSADTGVEEGQRYTETKLQDLLLSRDVKRARVGGISLHLTSTNLGEEEPQLQHLATSLYRESRKVWRRATLASTFSKISSKQRECIFTQYSGFEVDLSVHFSLVDRKGSVTVFGLQPGPSRSTIRAITHPTLDAASGADKGKIRSLYAQTVREKATLLSNILSSPLGLETNPVAVHHITSREEGKEGGTVRFVVRNFSDVYQARIVLQLQGAWEGRKTLRCDKIGPGETREVEATREVMEGGEGGRRQVNFVVDVETSLPTAERDGERVVVGRYSEHY